MLYKTHITTSLCAGIGLTMMTDISLTASFMGGVLIGSLLPDIDEPNSYVGSRTKGLSHTVKLVFGHRGFTHSLTCTALVFLLYLFFPNHFFLGLTFGFLFHILGDMLSVSGVPLLLPFTKKRFRIPLYQTGQVSEKIIFLLAFILFLYLLIANMERILSVSFLT